MNSPHWRWRGTSQHRDGDEKDINFSSSHQHCIQTTLCHSIRMNPVCSAYYALYKVIEFPLKNFYSRHSHALCFVAQSSVIKNCNLHISACCPCWWVARRRREEASYRLAEWRAVKKKFTHTCERDASGKLLTSLLLSQNGNFKMCNTCSFSYWWDFYYLHANYRYTECTFVVFIFFF